MTDLDEVDEARRIATVILEQWTSTTVEHYPTAAFLHLQLLARYARSLESNQRTEWSVEQCDACGASYGEPSTVPSSCAYEHLSKCMVKALRQSQDKPHG